MREDIPNLQSEEEEEEKENQKQRKPENRKQKPGKQKTRKKKTEGKKREKDEEKRQAGDVIRATRGGRHIVFASFGQLAWFHSEELLGRIATSRRKLLIRSRDHPPPGLGPSALLPTRKREGTVVSQQLEF